MNPRPVNHRVINTHALLIGQQLVDLCENILTPEERQVAFEAFFQCVREGLEAAVLEHQHILKRLRPLDN